MLRTCGWCGRVVVAIEPAVGDNAVRKIFVEFKFEETHINVRMRDLSDLPI